MSSQESSRILDLTSKQTLYELAIEDDELLGTAGLKLIQELKERAGDADFTHLYFRDPLRPGIVWFCVLDPRFSAEVMDFEEIEGESQAQYNLPTRGKLDFCRQVTETVFPGFLQQIDPDSDENITSQIPPLSIGASGLELATALEYLVFIYPTMVRAWAALIFTYGEILGMHETAQTVRAECASICPEAQIVMYLLAD